MAEAIEEAKVWQDRYRKRGYVMDGIYIGATAASAIRNVMLISAVSFFATFYLAEEAIGIQALYLAYAMHLVVRSLLMTLFAKKEVTGKIPVTS